MTREEFDKLYLGKAVHCDTEEKANEFLALADSVGYKWGFSERKLTSYNEWEKYKKETCYRVTKWGFLFVYVEFLKDTTYEIIEYKPQPKFKVGDKVRVNNPPFTTLNGEVGVIVDEDLSIQMSYAVKVGHEGWTFWFYEKHLEKVKEPTHKEETIDDIIKDIKEHQKSINVLLNKLERKIKKEK